MVDRVPLRRALVSVYDKAGLEDLGRALAAAGVDLVSTGATAARLREAGCAVTDVAAVTGFPECLDGRVKTLHPRIHAGLLADRRRDAHTAQLVELGVEPFDLVVSNLYPFAATVASGAPVDECVEQIDIGGPAMVRAAAKNHAGVAVVTSPSQYDGVKAALTNGGYTLAERRALAVAAFRHTAAYDVAVATWLGEALAEPGELPDWVGATWTRTAGLRYGENAHQAAALYTVPGLDQGLAGARLLHGKAMSYNNYTDAEAAYRACYDFAAPAVAIVKHANPCGIALGPDIAAAHRKAHDCDPLSAYGGVIAANRVVTEAMAAQVAPIFTEVVVAPGFEPAALELLTAKKNLRLVEAGPYPAGGLERRALAGGGLLVQTPDRLDAPGDDPRAWQLKAGAAADAATLADLEFAWRACRAVKSNAILLARDGASVGVGMGQVNRVDSCRLAVERAGARAAGSVAASDAFFPFADGPEILIAGGVRAIVEPGGSIRDDDTVAACAAAGVTLYFTGTRHFFH
jgi:phosphoribosylaminoimidazolecarboxamide formyltransferase/IMP cyclohydrolase